MNKLLIVDTAEFLLFNEKGELIVKLDTTKQVDVYKRHGETFISVEDALLDTKMIEILGSGKNQKELSDFEKHVGIQNKSKSVTIRKDVEEEKEFKAIVRTVAYDPDSNKLSQKIDMSFPSVTLNNSNFASFIHGEAYQPEYTFKVEDDYDVTITEIPKKFNINDM